MKKYFLLMVWSVLIGPAFLVGCASYQSKIHKARSLLPTNASLAAEKLKEKANKKGPDQLVYLLDYATALQSAGRYEESSKALDIAFHMSDQKDYISVSKQLGSVLVTQGLVQYSGKPFEKDLITIMSAINFLGMSRPDKARVEIKRAYDRVNVTKEKNSALGYLAGLVWEVLGEYDSARISYQEAFDQGYVFSGLTKAIKRMESFSDRKQTLPSSEVVVIYAQGWTPRLKYDLQFKSLPRMVPVYSKNKQANISIGDDSKSTDIFYSVANSFSKNFQKDLAGATAKRTFSYVVKEGTAHTVSKEDQVLGQVVRVLLHSSDWADLRHWSTLPESLQVARFELPPGNHKVAVRAGSVSRDEDVTLLPGQKKFLFVRGY